MPAIMFKDIEGWMASYAVFDELGGTITVVRNPDDDDRPIHIVSARAWPRLVELLQEAGIEFELVGKRVPAMPGVKSVTSP